MKLVQIFLCTTGIIYAVAAPVFSQSTITVNSPQSSAKTPPYTLYKQGKYRQAIQRADELIKQDSGNISAYAVKGWSYLSLRQWQRALNTAQIAYNRNSTDRRVIEILGEANYELGNYDDALRFFESYLRIAPNGQLLSWVYYFVGMIYYKRQKLGKADIALTTAMELEMKDKGNPRVALLVSLATVKEKRNQIPQALAMYRKVLSVDANNTTARQAIVRLGS